MPPSVDGNDNLCPKCGAKMSGGPQCPQCGVYYEKVSRINAPSIKPRRYIPAKAIVLIAVAFLGILIGLLALKNDDSSESSSVRANTEPADVDSSVTKFIPALVAGGADAHRKGDYALALSVFRAAADMGDALSQFFLGGMYSEGQGVPQDYIEAVRWFRIAARQGKAEAQWALGVHYNNGRGVPRSDTEAVRWFRLAAEQGYAAAQRSLGQKYASGEGVSRSDAEAVRWWHRAAEQGDAQAQSMLGGMYALGRGVPRNNVYAYQWASLSNAQGDKLAAQLLTGLEQLMTREQVAEGQRLAAEAWESMER